MELANHPAGYRQITLRLFDESIVVVPYPPCSELFDSLVFPPDPNLLRAVIEENYYQFYYALAAAIRPRTYLEIGTRFGYSTISVARGAPKLRRIVSCDLETYENPNALSSQQIAERNLRASGYTGETAFIVDDSRRLLQHVAGDSFDLILVDGDHSYEGCRSDMMTCYELLTPRGVMLIDDLDQPPVFSAVVDCMQELNVAVSDRCFVPTKHGLHLVRRPQVPAILAISE